MAQELFATTWDAYLTLDELPPEPESRHTADGRPATVAAARDRLARQICADRTLFSDEDAHAAALAIVQAQTAKVAIGVRQVLGRCGTPRTVVLAGQGRCLGQRLLERLSFTGTVVVLDEVLGPEASRAAAAHALAVLAREEFP